MKENLIEEDELIEEITRKVLSRLLLKFDIKDAVNSVKALGEYLENMFKGGKV